MSKEFRDTTVSDGSTTRFLGVYRNRLHLGSIEFTKIMVKKSLKRKHGSFFCSYRYKWKLKPNGGIVFNRKNEWFPNNDVTGSLSPLLVKRISKWADSK